MRVSSNAFVGFLLAAAVTVGAASETAGVGAGLVAGAASSNAQPVGPTSKLIHGKRDAVRDRRRKLNKAILKARGIKTRDDYDEKRMQVDVSKDLHKNEVRRLAQKAAAVKELKSGGTIRASGGSMSKSEEAAFWQRFLQGAASITPSPTRSPVAPPTPPVTVPPPTPPTPPDTPAPVAPPPPDTPAPVAPTPPDTPAPVAPTPPDTPAPVAPTPPDTPAPVPQIPPDTPAPVASTPAPVASTPAPVASTPAPVASTPAPVASTPAPVASTPAPVAATPEPTASPTSSPTPAPVVSTPAPTPSPTAAPTPGSNGARDIILPVALFDGTEFNDPATYQSKSLAWLEGSSIAGLSDAKVIQRYALGCIYYATNNVSTTFTDLLLGPGIVFPWNNERAWLSDTDECTWSNVQCDDSTGFIRRMDFFGNFMSGELPPEITYMKSTLQNLDVSDNPVFTRGETFNTWLGMLTELQILRYEDTNFINSNGIPTEIANLKNLGFYECSNVRYIGALDPRAFPSDMTQLSYLEMEFNTFNSPIPTEIGLLPNLMFFYARGSSITGGLDFMRTMSNAVEVWTDRNPGMTGNLPTFLGDLSTLGSFSVTRSGWSGPLPTELGQLAESMKKMFFFENQFTGGVPSEWGALTNLEELEVQNNLLTEQIPVGVCRLKFTFGLNLEADCEICPTNCCSACVP